MTIKRILNFIQESQESHKLLHSITNTKN